MTENAGKTTTLVAKMWSSIVTGEQSSICKSLNVWKGTWLKIWLMRQKPRAEEIAKPSLKGTSKQQGHQKQR